MASKWPSARLPSTPFARGPARRSSAPSGEGDDDMATVERRLRALLLASLALNAAWVVHEVLMAPRALGTSPVQAAPSPGGGRANETGQAQVPPLQGSVSAGVEVQRSSLEAALGPDALLSDDYVAAKLSIGGQPCVTRELQALLQHLHGIVLIININYDSVALSTADFLRQVYGRFFDNVVIIGPNELPQVGVEARGHRDVRLHWGYAYFHLPAVMARFPHAAGFLWTNDDVVLNYWNLLRTNTSKLWLPVTPECRGCHHFVPFQASLPEEVNDGWSGQAATRYKANRALATSDVKYIFQYRRSILPREEGYMKQVVDCFYIPRRLVEPLAFDLLPLFRDHRVPSEIAIPMIFNALEHPREYDPVFRSMVYRWERGPTYDPRRFWNSSLGAYHHWKLASRRLRRAFLGALSAADPCLGRLVPDLQEQERGEG